MNNMYFVEVVEHYFRLAVRSPNIRDPTSAKWKAVTLQWFLALPPDDKAFLREVFKYEHRTTRAGLLSIPGDYRLNRERLYALETAYAQHTKLI